MLPPIRAPLKRHAKKWYEQKCCPICLNLMRLVGDRYECAKHGAPSKP